MVPLPLLAWFKPDGAICRRGEEKGRSLLLFLEREGEARSLPPSVASNQPPPSLPQAFSSPFPPPVSQASHRGRLRAQKGPFPSPPETTHGSIQVEEPQKRGGGREQRERKKKGDSEKGKGGRRGSGGDPGQDGRRPRGDSAVIEKQTSVLQNATSFRLRVRIVSARRKGPRRTGGGSPAQGKKKRVLLARFFRGKGGSPPPFHFLPLPPPSAVRDEDEVIDGLGRSLGLGGHRLLLLLLPCPHLLEEEGARKGEEEEAVAAVASRDAYLAEATVKEKN